MTEMAGVMDDRRCPMLDINVVADDEVVVFFVRSATHHQ